MNESVSLVTGGNRGIGREVCRQLVARGHTVLLTARTAESATVAAQGSSRPHRQRVQRGRRPELDGWRNTRLHRLEGGAQRPDPHARQRVTR
ncbi:SDR family NAD(P)-dependent oxidoreductase [Nocardia alni]|uniref:SDR family NAD(P)-dependent oxidoreductase n=1 Tax=Nocardia alni TaxID=2815723 RepID=UPI0020B2E5DF